MITAFPFEVIYGLVEKWIWPDLHDMIMLSRTCHTLHHVTDVVGARTGRGPWLPGCYMREEGTPNIFSFGTSYEVHEVPFGSRRTSTTILAHGYELQPGASPMERVVQIAALGFDRNNNNRLRCVASGTRHLVEVMQGEQWFICSPDPPSDTAIDLEIRMQEATEQPEGYVIRH